MTRPFSQACENNKRPILEVLRRTLPGTGTVLEIGSGTGQHAAFFAEELPELVWQCSDLPENHEGIRAWIGGASRSRLPEPIALDVRQRDWPVERVDAVFSANTAHIMGWPAVLAMISGAASRLAEGGRLLLYGPFNYGGQYTSESNRSFDGWLAQRDPESAIRDFEAVEAAAREVGLELLEDCEMPANNRLLVFERRR